jgi:hypothetical protein
VKDKISDREINLIRIETLENMRAVPKTGLSEKMRKAVEDDKKRALIEAANLRKKSWQDNPWPYFAMGVLITVIGGIILKYVFGVI